ncbi:putative peptidyl-tRNA hydrolase PTRHD1 isoform X2 [Schistocerca serialis cubense]|uniref:putative peptidyl-tRNA hydrolase PTRHD1 isoform X2 n=1 Tax=Schistocerca serialis cubense TaxID=2023355 RepID=UPI00214E8DEC|nr:putative peptidyl-tRNA hydrolase PTRHD1 isoform X2 [Schistocerca serialis cubense]
MTVSITSFIFTIIPQTDLLVPYDMVLNSSSQEEMSKNLVQYIIMRGDLAKSSKWNAGALVAQACHGVSAVLHLYYNDENVQEYLCDVDRMHKVVLEISDLNSLMELETKLKNKGIHHKTWIEQPENEATCLVVKPYPKDDVAEFFKDLKLFNKKL